MNNQMQNIAQYLMTANKVFDAISYIPNLVEKSIVADIIRRGDQPLKVADDVCDFLGIEFEGNIEKIYRAFLGLAQ